MYNLFFDRILHSIGGIDAPFAFLGDGSRATYSDLLDWSGRYANSLVEMGLRPGDLVVLPMRADVHHLYLYLATLRAGGIFVPVSDGGNPDQLGVLVGPGDRRLIVFSDATSAVENRVVRGAGAATRAHHATTCQLLDLASRSSGQFQDVVRVPDDPAVWYLGSELTTFTHHRMVTMADRIVRQLRLTSSDRLVQAVPVSDPQGFLMAANLVLLSSGSMFLLEDFAGQAGHDALRAATYVAGSRDYYDELVASNALNQNSIRGIRAFLTNQTILSSVTQQGFQRMTGRSILPDFGAAKSFACA